MTQLQTFSIFILVTGHPPIDILNFTRYNVGENQGLFTGRTGVTQLLINVMKGIAQ